MSKTTKPASESLENIDFDKLDSPHRLLSYLLDEYQSDFNDKYLRLKPKSSNVHHINQSQSKSTIERIKRSKKRLKKLKRRIKTLTVLKYYILLPQFNTVNAEHMFDIMLYSNPHFESFINEMPEIVLNAIMKNAKNDALKINPKRYL